jgi:four helix bundle protein
MKIQKFEDIIAWQKSQDLCVKIYQHFRELKDFGYKDQIRRAALSISNNIAEGFDRKGDKEFLRFLYMALGSASETRSMLHLATRLNYLTDEQASSLLEQVNEVSRITRGLVKAIDASQ